VTPERALSEIDRLQQRVGTHGRWPGWVWLAAGLAMAAFGTLAPPVTGGLTGTLVAFGFAAFAIAVMAYVVVQRVVGRTPARLELQVTNAFVALVVVDVIFRIAASPTRLAAPVVVFGCLPALPMLYGAWRVWRE
jgi:hypothetical protein